MQLTALALWLNTAFAGFDEAVATAIHQLYVAAGWFFTPFLSFISLLGKGGIFLILLSIALMLFRKTRRYGTTMLLALAIGALVTNVCFKPLVARPRPYTHDGSIFQQYWEMLGKHTESDKSFPSGHMTAAMAASLAVFLRGNKKISWTALLFALAMGVSRIYLSVHYATDVLGGVITGSIGGFAGYAISNRIPESFYTADFRDYIDRLKAKRSGGKSAGRSAAAAAAAEPSDGRRRTLVIDGANFSTMDGLFREFNRLFDVGPDEAVHSLDALNDLLGGGIGKRLIVRFDHCLFQHTPELGIDGVDDIPEGLIGVFPAGHDDKELIACIDDLDIVDSELSVKRHRHDGLHGTILKQLSYFDVRDLHNMAPPLL